MTGQLFSKKNIMNDYNIIFISIGKYEFLLHFGDSVYLLARVPQNRSNGKSRGI